MNKDLVDLRKKNLEQLNAELMTCLLYTSDAADE